MKFLLTSFFVLGLFASSSRPKILCLHGGGGSAAGFSSSQSMRDLESSLPEYEFVYADAGYSGLWMRDPPGGKGEATTDPHWADASLDALDNIVSSQGPFYGILGYSQGSAYVPVYLAHAPVDTFQVAMMFCGYLPTTHEGILASLNAGSPFGDIPALVWMGQNDGIITNGMTQEQATKFTNPTIVVDSQADHHVPFASSETYNQVLQFVANNPASTDSNSGSTDSTTSSTESSDTEAPESTEAGETSSTANPNNDSSTGALSLIGSIISFFVLAF